VILLGLILTPLVFALAVALLPVHRARPLAMLGTLIPLALGIVALAQFHWGLAEPVEFERSIAWLPQLGLELSVGVDSISMLLILLTLLLGPICVAASFTAINERVKTYYAWMLVLQAAMVGVFAATDVIFFYVCFEFTLIPMFILIDLYGSTNRHKAAIKFFLFTFTGSVVALAGIVYVAWFHADQTGVWTFRIDRLAATARAMNPHQQALVLLALMIGFAVKVPLFPVHTWLPLAHTEAPTAGSVLLAGVLLKLGTYAIYRFALGFAPGAVLEYAPAIAALAIIGIIYAGLICWVQTDAKKLVAYSSVSHLGFCILGMVALNSAGLNGSVLYMVNHGLSTGALFLLIGMIYERYHTRSMRELGGLAARMPIWATFMVFFVLASVGLPGLNGFISEFLSLLGAFQAGDVWGDLPGGTGGNLGPWFAAVAATGMIVAAIYLLYMVGRLVFGPLFEPGGHDEHAGPLPRDLGVREIGLLVPLAAACLFLGVYPAPVLRSLEGPINLTIGRFEQAAAQRQRETGVRLVLDGRGDRAGEDAP